MYVVDNVNNDKTRGSSGDFTDLGTTLKCSFQASRAF